MIKEASINEILNQCGSAVSIIKQNVDSMSKSNFSAFMCRARPVNDDRIHFYVPTLRG